LFIRTCIPPNHLNSSKKILIASGGICEDKKSCILEKYSITNKKNYCDKHGYQLNYSTDIFYQLKKENYNLAWAKIKILLNLLETNSYDWLFWIDMDAFIMNDEINLEQLVDDRYSLIITKDHNYLNAGVFLIKNSSWSKKFLNTVWSMRNNYDNEQDMMIYVLENLSSENKIKYLPQCSMNSYWKMYDLYRRYQNGDFILHWAGHNWDEHVFNKVMKNFLT
jgi:hypothetical protein